MILILTNEFDPHADLVVRDLRSRQYPHFRLNAEDLFGSATCHYHAGHQTFLNSQIIVNTHSMRIADIQVIYTRGFSLEKNTPYSDASLNRFFQQEASAFILGTLFASEAQWFNNPAAVEKAAHKLYQLRLAMDLGFRVPETLATNDPDALGDFANRCPALVQKVLNVGRLWETDQAALLSYTRLLPSEDLGERERITALPSIYQEYIQKKSDIRVIVIVEHVVAVEICSQESGEVVDWRGCDVAQIPHRPHSLPDEIRRRCANFVKSCGLRFGAIDLVLTINNEYVFLELNPEGLWGWLELLADVKITPLLVQELIRLDSCDLLPPQVMP